MVSSCGLGFERGGTTPMSARIARSVREAITASGIPSTQTRVRAPDPRSSAGSGSTAKIRSARTYLPNPRKTIRGAPSGTFERALEGVRHALLVRTVEACVERQRHRARAAILAHRQHPLREAVPLRAPLLLGGVAVVAGG